MRRHRRLPVALGAVIEDCLVADPEARPEVMEVSRILDQVAEDGSRA